MKNRFSFLSSQKTVPCSNMSRPNQSPESSFLPTPAPAAASASDAPSDYYEVCALSPLSGDAHTPCPGKFPFFARGSSGCNGTGPKVELDGLGGLF